MNDRITVADNSFDNLRTLLAATTPGEWRIVESGDRPTISAPTGAALATVHQWHGRNDAAFIVAAHNELPALLARLDEVTAENAALAAVVSSAVGVVESYENWYEDSPEDSWRFERDIRDALNLTDKEENR